MKYTWDEEKRKANIAKHGLDFNRAHEVLTSTPIVDFIDARNDYGETRHLAYAEVKKEKMCLCYVARGSEIRVISLRRVHDKEWRKVWI